MSRFDCIDSVAGRLTAIKYCFWWDCSRHNCILYICTSTWAQISITIRPFSLDAWYTRRAWRHAKLSLTWFISCHCRVMATSRRGRRQGGGMFSPLTHCLLWISVWKTPGKGIWLTTLANMASWPASKSRGHMHLCNLPQLSKQLRPKRTPTSADLWVSCSLHRMIPLMFSNTWTQTC